MKNNLEQARKILSQASEKALTDHARTDLSIQLASFMLQASLSDQPTKEKKEQEKLSKIMRDPVGKAFTTAMTDQLFRSKDPERASNQILHLQNRLGTPSHLPSFDRLKLRVFKTIGQSFSSLVTPMTQVMLRKSINHVIVPGETEALTAHLQKRNKEQIRICLHHVGEAIFGEEEASKRVAIYLDFLSREDVDSISVKVTALYSQINLLAWDETIEILAHKLRLLFRAAMKWENHKFILLDMEEYSTFSITIALFKKVLNEDEFLSFSAGITLQAYLPDSFETQKDLTSWAEKRGERGGAPIKIRLVKGAHLAIEQYEALLKGWPQAPYSAKIEVDANFKRMITYAADPEHAKYVHIRIGSHNLFEIAYAMVVREENQVHKAFCFEMLEGMAPHLSPVVQKLVSNFILYCPTAKKDEFTNAISYLIRRYDDNSDPENFLCSASRISTKSIEWQARKLQFAKSTLSMHDVATSPRRNQNRKVAAKAPASNQHFTNEPETDFTLPQNREWAKEIYDEWSKKAISDPIPLVINEKEVLGPLLPGKNPSHPDLIPYHFSTGTQENLEQAIQAAKNAETSWSKLSISDRSSLLYKTAQEMRLKRAKLIGAMMLETGKTLVEADSEVSKAIDFCEFYRRKQEELEKISSLAFAPKGTIAVLSPWDFPCAIPTGGISAALMTGNTVIFKPSIDTPLISYLTASCFWKAGVPKNVLQLFLCKTDELSAVLTSDERVNAVVFAGSTKTAKKLLKTRPDLNLIAETSAINSFIITELADRDLAIKDLMHSAFSHSGQKCSTASLAIVTKEVYDDPSFLENLKDATNSLHVGPSDDPKTKINPLTQIPQGDLLKALTKLEKGESWLVEPKQDPVNPHLFSPGIKMGVKRGSFCHQTELLGPLFCLMRANDLKEAVEIANDTSFGLTASLHSLDDREQEYWLKNIVAGNLYINRATTGAIVERQPFGGTKASSFGPGFKTGGPHYLLALQNVSEKSLPKLDTSAPIPFELKALSKHLVEKQRVIFDTSIANYAEWAQDYKSPFDVVKIPGQHNLQAYTPQKNVLIRIRKSDSLLDTLRLASLVFLSRAECIFSTEGPLTFSLPSLNTIQESEEDFIKRLPTASRLWQLSPSNSPEFIKAIQNGLYILTRPVLAHGKVELLFFLREVSISLDYHRYGTPNSYPLSPPIPSFN